MPKLFIHCTRVETNENFCIMKNQLGGWVTDDTTKNKLYTVSVAISEPAGATSPRWVAGVILATHEDLIISKLL